MPCVNVKQSDISTIRHRTRFHFLVLHNTVLWTFWALCSFGFVSRLLDFGGDYVNGSKLLIRFTFFPVSLVNDTQVEWHAARYYTPQHEPAQKRQSHWAIIWHFFLCLFTLFLLFTLPFTIKTIFCFCQYNTYSRNSSFLFSSKQYSWLLPQFIHTSPNIRPYVFSSQFPNNTLSLTLVNHYSPVAVVSMIS